MVIGVGTDILLIDRISRAPFNITDAFMIKTYTENERKQAMERPDPTLYFASRFAGKEAVFKTLGVSGDEVRQLRDIEILSAERGMPAVTLHGKVAEIASQKKITQVLLSLSQDTDYVVAYAIANGEKE